MRAVLSKTSPDSHETSLHKLTEFSLVAGGPLYQLLRRGRLSGEAMELAWRRVFVLVVLMWSPLLALSILEGHAWDSNLALPFLKDIETNLRLLIAVPLLILAEVMVHKKLPPIVRRFVENGLIRDDARPQFEAAITSAQLLRNSIVAEVVLIVFVYGVGIPFVWRDLLVLDVNSWYAISADGGMHPSYAGWWFGLVSMPLLQFLVLRWFFRFFIWARFLWQVARTGLNLEPTHPDGTAGLHFLAHSSRAFEFVSLAAGTMASGVLANRIFYTGAKLLEFKIEIVGAAVALVFLILGPLIVFCPQLWAARRRGLEEFSVLGQIYASEFSRKWLRSPRVAVEPLLGSPDIQSLADLRNSFEVIRGIKPVPFTMKNVAFVGVTTLLPIAPLLLTTFSVDQLVERVLKVLL
jgi:hypothetical protein